MGSVWWLSLAISYSSIYKFKSYITNAKYNGLKPLIVHQFSSNEGLAIPLWFFIPCLTVMKLILRQNLLFSLLLLSFYGISFQHFGYDFGRKIIPVSCVNSLI